MRKFVGLSVIMLLVLGVAGPTWALQTYTNSGTYMFTVSGNDPSSPSADQSALEQLIKDWLLNNRNLVKDVDLDFYAKVDESASTTTEGSGSLELTYGRRNKSGTWKAAEAIDFYSVKAGNQYGLYWVDPRAMSGTWSTEHLLIGKGYQTSSHVSTWKMASNGLPPSAPAVPEPSTVLLLGAGLLGLVGLRIKRNKT